MGRRLSKDHRKHGPGRDDETQHRKCLEERTHFSHDHPSPSIKDSAKRRVVKLGDPRERVRARGR